MAALSIEAIDEQNITIFTKDYELEIDIGGAPDRAYVDGDMEGFYHEWDATSSKIKIKSEKVTRLIRGALWKVHLVKGTKKLDSQITYNVMPAAPVISDPGTQKLYKGGSFWLDIDIANSPSIARGSGLLSGLKYAARADGKDGLNIAGRLPADVNLTETAFDAAIYAENSGGNDNLKVPITIETHQGVYVFDSQTDDLLKIGPDAATRHWTYEAPYPGKGNFKYDSIVASPDGIYLFSDVSDDLLKVSPDGALLWTFSDASKGTYNSIVVTQSGPYLFGPAIYKVHPATGQLIWESNERYSSNGFLVFDGDVYLYYRKTSSPAVHSLTKLNGETGAVEWVYNLPSTSGSSPPVAYGDGVYLRHYNVLRKISPATGKQVWTHNLGTSSGFTPVINSTGIYFVTGTSTNKVLKINIADGTRAWTWTAPAAGYSAFFLDSDAFYLYNTSKTKTLLRINLTTGAQVWLVQTSANQIKFPAGGIYGTYNSNSNLTKFNKSTGATDWTVAVSNFRQNNLTPDLIQDGSDLYLPATSGTPNDLVKLNVSDGSQQWRYVGKTSGHYASLAIPVF